MSTITIEIPDEIAFDLKIPKERWNIECAKNWHCNCIKKDCFLLEIPGV